MPYRQNARPPVAPLEPPYESPEARRVHLAVLALRAVVFMALAVVTLLSALLATLCVAAALY